MGGVVDVAPGAAAADPRGARHRIDADALHRREVDHEAALAGAKAGAVVAAAADGEQQAMVAGEADGGDDIARVGTAGDQRRPLVDHGVEDRASLVVARILGADEAAAQGRGKSLHVSVWEGGVRFDRCAHAPSPRWICRAPNNSAKTH